MPRNFAIGLLTSFQAPDERRVSPVACTVRVADPALKTPPLLHPGAATIQHGWPFPTGVHFTRLCPLSNVRQRVMFCLLRRRLHQSAIAHHRIFASVL